MKTILDAATNPTLRGAAFDYVEAGCSIIPTQSKKPNGVRWEIYQHRRARNGEVNYWFSSGKMGGIGLVCGEVSGNLVVLDVDNMNACREFERSFPLLKETLTIRSGSYRGRHYYFYADTLPLNTWLQGVELRADGAYVVAPPSMHPCGNRYCVEVPFPVRRVANLEDVRDWIMHRADALTPTPRANPKPAYPAIRDATAYGRAALTSECISVRTAPAGTRNNTLFRAALKMGTLINAGHLTKSEVEYQLETAAIGLSQSDGLETTQRTIQSGILKGMANPNTRRVG